MNQKINTTLTRDEVGDAYVVSDFNHKLVFGQEAYDKFAAVRKRLRGRGKTLLLLRWKDGRTEQWVDTIEEGPWSIQAVVNLNAVFTAFHADKLKEA